MTPRADLLDQVKTPGKIKFVAAASGALLPVIGVGNAKVMGANGEVVGLGNVLLVEGLSANLLSVHRLQKSKAEVTFGPTSCRAKLGKMLLWNLEEKSSCIKDLWQLPIIPWKGKPPAIAKAAGAAKATAGGEESAPTAAAMDAVKKVQQPQQPHREVLAGVDATAAWAKASSGSGEADWEMWHERLCHVNIPMLQKLVKDGCLKGLEVKGGAKEIGNCPTCLETKFTKFPFSSSTGPAKAPLALVHMDVVGPTRALSLSGSRYFLTIVDDHTRAVWVYPLKTKGEVAAAVLKEWMPRAQRESGHKVKVIRTDNGGEFIGADVEKELKRKGIQHQLTVPYNPEQNGVAERFNRTLQEGARTLIGRAGLPDPFWVTALRQVVVVKNREKRGKLEASGRWGVHLGLAKDHKGWLIWDLTSQQLTVSRDVKFLESLYYKEWKQQQQQKLPMTPLIVEADEVQRPSRQVEVSVSKEEISGVTDDGGEPEVEQQQQQQQEEQGAPQGAGRTADRPRRDVRPPNRLTYASRGKPKVSTTGDLTECYLTTNKPFGGEGKSWLVNFLKVHKEGGGKQVRVRGVDGEGRPINHLYTMHERKLKGHKQGSTYADCVKLCRQFARDCVDNLNERLDDLGKLGLTKLFRAGKWPKIKAQREKKCKEWLHGCSRLFRHKLPGFNLKAAERELPTFCAIMESHYEMESFAQGLNNFLGSVDSKRRWPNLILLWQALAVLPLSTVECERGFSRQNIIKSWVRGALCSARLGELMQISLLKYEIEWPEALEVWRSMRRRRPVKSLKLAVVERERKGKQKEGEVVAAGTAGENEDEGEEEEDDDEVEQYLGDDQEVVEEEDNPFLSDDEDVEEVYFIDKPVH
ncbi:unnamed protein product [Closterium sp. NIES-54]